MGGPLQEEVVCGEGVGRDLEKYLLLDLCLPPIFSSSSSFSSLSSLIPSYSVALLPSLPPFHQRLLKWAEHFEDNARQTETLPQRTLWLSMDFVGFVL